MKRSSILIVLALTACDSTVEGLHEDAAIDYTPTLTPGACAAQGTGTLPGVTIEVSAPTCVFKRGEGGTFHFTVTTTAVPAIGVPAADTCNCLYRAPELATWIHPSISGTSVSGEHQSYSTEASGCCAPQAAMTVTPETAALERDYVWSGRNWAGPSDYGAPEGDYFLHGRYTLYVPFDGFDQGRFVAELPIEVLP